MLTHNCRDQLRGRGEVCITGSGQAQALFCGRFSDFEELRALEDFGDPAVKAYSPEHFQTFREFDRLHRQTRTDLSNVC